MVLAWATAIGSTVKAAYRHRSRLTIFILPWLVVIGVGVPLLWIQIEENIREPMVRNREETLSQANDVLSRTLDRLGRDVLFLASLQSRFGSIGTAPEVNAEIFRSFSESSVDYDQVRWIDETGKERLRVNRRGGAPVIVADNALQDKASRPYFSEAVQLPPDGIYFSALDLNVENGTIEVPHQPMLRVASPVYDNGRARGVVVINYRATRLLERLKRLDRSVDLYLTNRDGYWIQGPVASENWGWQLGAPASLRIRQPALWSTLISADAGQWSGAGEDWTFRRFEAGANLLTSGDATQMRAVDAGFYLLAHASTAATLPQEARAKLLLGTMATLMVAMTAVIALRLARNMEAEAEWSRRLEATNRALQETNARLVATQRELARVERLSSLGLMVAGVAHELNTPLGSATLTLSKASQDLERFRDRIGSGLRRSDLDLYVADCDASLELARDAVHRCAALVQRFKQLAIDRATLQRRDVDLADFIPDADPRLRRWDSSNGIGLEWDVPPGIAIATYPGPLAQVITNLLNNALAHAFQPGDAGTITIRARWLDDDQFVMQFADDGRGIAAADLGQIFEPFFSTARHAGGTGLGLHIVHQTVTEVLGGTISAESPHSRGMGAQFTLRLPRNAPRMPDTATKASRPA